MKNINFEDCFIRVEYNLPNVQEEDRLIYPDLRVWFGDVQNGITVVGMDSVSVWIGRNDSIYFDGVEWTGSFESLIDFVLSKVCAINTNGSGGSVPAGLATEATLALLRTEVSKETTLASLLASFNAEDFASQTTLAAVLTALQAGGASANPTAGTGKIFTSVVSGVGTTTDGILSLSVTNIGSVSGTWNGKPLAPGLSVSVSIEVDPSINKSMLLPSISYNASGTTFYITEYLS